MNWVGFYIHFSRRIMIFDFFLDSVTYAWRYILEPCDCHMNLVCHEVLRHVHSYYLCFKRIKIAFFNEYILVMTIYRPYVVISKQCLLVL